MTEIVREIDWDALVRRYDPYYDREPDVEYVFGSGAVIKTKPQERPGETYSWLQDEE